MLLATGLLVMASGPQEGNGGRGCKLVVQCSATVPSATREWREGTGPLSLSGRAGCHHKKAGCHHGTLKSNLQFGHLRFGVRQFQEVPVFWWVSLLLPRSKERKIREKSLAI